MGSRKRIVMAKPKTGGSGGGGGGGGDKGPSVLNKVLIEMAGDTLGFIAGAVLTNFARGMFSELKEKAKTKILGSKPGDAKATKDDVAKAKEEFNALVESCDDKELSDLAKAHYKDIVDIRARGGDEVTKDEKVKQATEKFEAAVNKRLVAISRQDFDKLVDDLDPTVRIHFIRWLIGLDPKRRAAVESAKNHIKSKAIIDNMLSFDVDSKKRFEFLMAVLPRPDIKDQVEDAFQAFMRGKAGKHPLVKSFKKSNRRAAEKIWDEVQEYRANYRERKAL
jgi:hypothetical protein